MKIALKKVLILLCIAALGLLPLGLGACASSVADELADEPLAEQVYRSLGSESSSSIALEVSNATAQTIVAFEVINSSDEDYEVSLFTGDSSIVTGETVVIHLEPPVSGGSRAENNSAASAALFDIALIFSGGTEAVLHNLCLEELVSLKVYISSDGIAHAEYADVNGKYWCTLKAEQALKQAEEDAEAALLAQAAAAAQAEAEAAAAAAAQSSSSGYSYNTGGGGAAAPSTGSQNPDVCVDDLVFR